jgi:tuberous sclerosis protein 2
MPTNLEKDPASNKKKRHIGNDYVTIVYNDSGNGQSFKLVRLYLPKIEIILKFSTFSEMHSYLKDTNST